MATGLGLVRPRRLSKENDEGWVASISPAIQSYRPTNHMSIYSYGIVRIRHDSTIVVPSYSYSFVRLIYADTVSSQGVQGFKQEVAESGRDQKSEISCQVCSSQF